MAERVEKTQGRISAKRLLPKAKVAGYVGSARNFRRLVARAKREWRRGHHRGRRPGVWTPGDMLIIDWGVEGGLQVFCAVLAWSRFRFVRFAADERATTTLRLLAECFEVLGGVPAAVLADRMGCLKAGVVANVVVPTPDYVRFATYYGFRPDFCEAADPESKGMVENLVGYAKGDLMVPRQPFGDLAGPTTPQRCGVARSTPPSMPRSAPLPPSGSRPNGSCCGRCRRCGPRSDPGDHPEGRQAVLHPVRVGPLLGAVPADREPRHHHHHRDDDRGRAGDR